ncbi:MAG: response regulator transcription factor [Nitratireductor sp.]
MSIAEQKHSGTRIIIVDPHPLVREGLRTSLEQKRNFEVVAEAGDGLAGLYAAARHRDAVLITNAQLPDTSAVDLVRRYKAETGDRGGAVICHVSENPTLLRQLVESTASAFLGQNAGSREYLAAVEAVSAGGIYISRNLMSCLISLNEPARAKTNPYKLTDRELDILNMLADGLSNKEVAHKLELSVRTVEAHRFSLRQKTGANILSDLVRISKSLDLSQGEGGSSPILKPALSESVNPLRKGLLAREGNDNV